MNNRLTAQHWAEDEYVNGDPEKPKKRERPKRGPKPRRCLVCRGHLESDGYGEWVHAETGFYLDYDEKGNVGHVAVAR